MSVLAACLVPHPPMIVPEVGGGREKTIQRTIDAYREVMRRIGELKPETVVVASPHSVLYADYFHISPGEGAEGDFSAFGARGGNRYKAVYDRPFAEGLAVAASMEGLAAGGLGERDRELDHGTLVPLHFLNEFYTDYRLVRMSLSGFSVTEHYRLGKCVAQLAEQLDRRTVFIASGDLSHRLKDEGPYSYAPEGPAFDKEIMEIAGSGDFLRLLSMKPDLCQGAGECGYRSLVMLAGALDERRVEAEALSYEGPFGVGYGVAWFVPTERDRDRRFDLLFEEQELAAAAARREGEDAYVRLARLSLESRIEKGKATALPEQVAEKLPEEMLRQKAGVFVSLKKYGQLRGCIGTIQPTERSVALEIWRNAISAGLQDSRFSPVEEEELPYLTYSVDVLRPPESIDSMEQLDVKRYGVIVSSGPRRGLLLPNLEGVDTPEQQVEIALQKAGIGRKEKYKMQRFEVVRHT
ncbi:MAG: AmmeMemoRadiSam system protein A [Bacillota bacterium]|nr:AmmeMemoRadiSam system protein A [Bacillota bacterium]